VGVGFWFARGTGTVEATGDAGFILSPANGSYATGSTINVSISENSTAGDNTNAVQVGLTFPAGLLSWQSTNLTGPFTLCAQNSHGAGTVSLACAATAAQTGTQAIATVSFKVLAAGNATVALASGSDIDNTSGSSVWNGTLPSAGYTLTSPSGGGSTPAPTPTPAPSKSSGSSSKPAASSTPAPTATPAAHPSASPSSTPSAAPTASAALGSISITVSDDKGRVVGATVYLDGQSKETNSSGLVNFAGVKSGSHDIKITAIGDKTFFASINLSPGENALRSYKLTKNAQLPPLLVWLLAGGGVAVALGAAAFWYLSIRPGQMPVSNIPAFPSNPAQSLPSSPASPISTVPGPAPATPGTISNPAGPPAGPPSPPSGPNNPPSGPSNPPPL
jgi:hypothetical protein